MDVSLQMSAPWPMTLIVLIASGSFSSQREQSLAPAPGVTPPPGQASPHRFLSDVITERRLVEPSVMRSALQASLAGRSLTEILVADGALSENDLAHTLAEHHGLDHVDLDVFAVDAGATALVDAHVARRLGAVPIAFLPSGTLVVALHEPNGSTAAVELAHLTDRAIRPAVASKTQIEALIRTLPARAPQLVAAIAPIVATGADTPPVAAVPQAQPVVASAGGQPPKAAPAPSGGGSLPPDGAAGLSMHFDGHLETLHQRAELAEHRRREADERAGEAQELARVESERADAAEGRAQTAEGLIDAADARAEDVAATVTAANAALARLLRACEILEHEAQAYGARTDALRAELDGEREARAEVEQALRTELEAERGERTAVAAALRAELGAKRGGKPHKLRRVKDARKRGGGG